MFTQAEFQRHLDEHRLMAAHCRTCGAVHLPPRPVCPACHGREMEWAELSGRGKLAGFTVVHIAPTAMVEAGYGRDNPYCVGVVELEEGPRISAWISGVDTARPQTIAVGAPLAVEFIDRGEGEDRRVFLAFAPANA